MKKFKFTISGKPYEVEVQDIENNIATVSVNGVAYKVEMEEQEAPAPVARPAVKKAAPAASAPAAAKSGTHKIEAPLPGSIMQIFVKEGDVVKKGDKLLMYEAMKMENNLLADIDGTIAAIKCKQGDNVLQGNVLIEIA